MKIACQTVIFLISMTNVFGQQNGAFLDRNDFPKGLEISIDTAKHTWVINRECLGQVTFSNTKKAVTYHVFYHNAADSLAFKEILKQRLVMENCQWNGSKNQSRGIPISFIRKDYYFLSEFCPCGSQSKGACGELAFKINRWLKGS